MNVSQYLGSLKVNLSNLTNLKTIVFTNETYTLGIDQGPMQSLTGNFYVYYMKVSCNIVSVRGIVLRFIFHQKNSFCCIMMFLFINNNNLL